MGVITALGELLSPQYLLMMIAGTMGGIMIGAMPGLTSVMGVTLLLPFTYGMDPAAGISMLLAISFGTIYGGSITAILIGTPGTPASAATIPLLQIPEILSPREASAPGRKPLQYRKVRRTIAANGNQKRKHGHDFGIGKESAALLDPAVP